MFTIIVEFSQEVFGSREDFFMVEASSSIGQKDMLEPAKYLYISDLGTVLGFIIVPVILESLALPEL